MAREVGERLDWQVNGGLARGVRESWQMEQKQDDIRALTDPTNSVTLRQLGTPKRKKENSASSCTNFVNNLTFNRQQTQNSTLKMLHYLLFRFSRTNLCRNIFLNHTLIIMLNMCTYMLLSLTIPDPMRLRFLFFLAKDKNIFLITYIVANNLT